MDDLTHTVVLGGGDGLLGGFTAANVTVGHLDILQQLQGRVTEHIAGLRGTAP